MTPQRYRHETYFPNPSEPMLAEELDRVEWYIFRTAPQKETPSTAWLARNGIPDAWHPTETRWKPIRGKARKLPYERATAPGYLFVPFTRRPVWHVLFERANRKLLQVISQNNQPLRIPERALKQMKQMPGRIAMIEERQRKAREINAGDKAEMLDGPYAGFCMDISEVNNGIAYFVLPLLGGSKGSAPVDKMRKVQE